MTYDWERNKYWLPTEIRQEALEWVNYGIMPKSEWLRAFIICDFHSIFAFARTSEQKAQLSDIYAWLAKCAPSECWGHLFTMHEWWHRKSLEREKYLKGLNNDLSDRHRDNGEMAEPSSPGRSSTAEVSGVGCDTCE